MIYYVASPGRVKILFAGTWGLRNALAFAAFARRQGQAGVSVGVHK